jgi:hypothetical protein
MAAQSARWWFGPEPWRLGAPDVEGQRACSPGDGEAAFVTWSGDAHDATAASALPKASTIRRNSARSGRSIGGKVVTISGAAMKSP